jgi:hypothetical protein
LDNNKVEQLLPQYVELVLQTKDLEEHAFAIEIVYQTKREHKVEHNTPPIIIVVTKVQEVD